MTSDPDDSDPPENGSGPALSEELVSLVHHVELHRSGWWEKALDRMLLVGVWLNQPCTTAQVIQFLDDGMDHRVARERIEALIEREVASGTLVQHQNHLFVSEEYGKTLEHERTEVAKSEEILRA